MKNLIPLLTTAFALAFALPASADDWKSMAKPWISRLQAQRKCVVTQSENTASDPVSLGSSAELKLTEIMNMNPKKPPGGMLQTFKLIKSDGKLDRLIVLYGPVAFVPKNSGLSQLALASTPFKNGDGSISESKVTLVAESTLPDEASPVTFTIYESFEQSNHRLIVMTCN